MVALSEDEALLGRLFQYRFAAGRGLKGHSFGNLFYRDGLVNFLNCINNLAYLCADNLFVMFTVNPYCKEKIIIFINNSKFWAQHRQK